MFSQTTKELHMRYIFGQIGLANSCGGCSIKELGFLGKLLLLPETYSNFGLNT